jgi:predicted RNase H-like HicB family nuclease
VELASRSENERQTYNVIAERAGDIWFVSVPSIPGALASTRRHDQIEAIARVVIAQALHVAQDSFDVETSSSDVR